MLYSDDKMIESYNEVRDLLKVHNSTDSIVINYNKLDMQTQEELRQAIQKVLHKRYNELASNINGVSEFVIHNKTK